MKLRNGQFILLALTPILAAAQAAPPASVAKPSPATSAAPATNLPARPVVAPVGQQLVGSDNFYRSSGKASANMPVQAPAPLTAAARNSAPPQPVNASTLAPQAAIAQTPVSNPQPAVSQAAEIKPPNNGTSSVDYRHGQLTVISERAPLGVVLKLIGAKTGAFVDIAPELQNEPVVATLGPGPVREVLAELLDSPRVDYIVMGTGDTPGSLERIVVRTRQSFARTALAAIHRPQMPPADAGSTTPNTSASPAAEAKLTQEQLMENWKKIREERRVAEIEQQRQERENENNEPQAPPQPQQTPDNNQADNPPQN